MGSKRLHSPEIDRIVEWMRRGPSQMVAAASLVKRIAHTLDVVRKIAPQISHGDKSWALWLRSERGDLSDYGSLDEFKEEGMANSQEEFEALWKEEYPDELKWHEVGLLSYQDRLFLTVDSRCQIEIDFHAATITDAAVVNRDVRDFMTWLLHGLETEVEQFLKHPADYNRFIADHLPLRKRIGKIRRKDVWERVSDVVREDRELGAEHLERFERAARTRDERQIIPDMTVRDFLRYCEIGYDANEYFRDAEKRLSPKEKYEAYADSRHGGLLGIDPDSPAAFRKWYEGDKWAGTHPWEVCRGGNSTHVSFAVAKEGAGWQLHLDGYRRAVEVARMAIALSERNVPFILHQQHEILTKLQGVDYLGIVPEHMTSHYAHDLFPREDEINDFLNPWHDSALAAVVKEKAVWYPVEALHAGGHEDTKTRTVRSPSKKFR